jgi:phosphate acetyltransferase/phosphate butyryltransferase
MTMEWDYSAAAGAAGKRFQEVIDLAARRERIRMAVVHPVDSPSLLGALEAREKGLIEAVLVGPEKKIAAAAAEAGVDLSGVEVVAAEHSHDAAEKAVEMARAGKVDAIMKGALHTDELMHPVIDKAKGLRTERRVSHVFALDVPTYPKHLFITDAAINIAPDLEAKRDIVQNAIDLARALGNEKPKVAVLGPVEVVTPKIPATVDAAALCKMADRRQITGGVVDGPLAFDNAISAEAARTKGIVSDVAGEADILVVPELNSGNMLAKQLEYLAGALTAGIVVGSRVPIALTSRADKPLARLASCALAKILAHHQVGATP